MVNAWFFEEGRNFGDAFNRDLIECLSGEVVNRVDASTDYKQPVFACCGSVLSFLDIPCVVWGAGLISNECTLITRPSKITAVRGPRTRDRLKGWGIECPEIYGDPGLLMPTIYRFKDQRDYELGIVPHYRDRTSEFLPENIDGVKVINVYDLPINVARTINRCKRIISSSLHGLIAADAYGIPSLWVEFSDFVVGKGFKFYDYYDSMMVAPPKPPRIDHPVNWLKLANECELHPIKVDLKALRRACPFWWA
jgi:pyruvyltransferase